MKRIIGPVIISPYLNKRGYSVNKTYTIVIRVYFNREIRYFGVKKMKATESKWNTLFRSRTPSRIKEAQIIMAKYNEICIHTQHLVDKGMFTHANLRSSLNHNKKLKSYRFIDDVIDDFVEQKITKDKINTAGTYTSLQKSLEYCFNRKVRVLEINHDFLVEFEKKLRDRGNSDATIGIRMRNLRHIFRSLIKNGFIAETLYPFKDYTIPKGYRRKLALPDDVLDTIKAEAQECVFFRLWILSYYMHGMNFCDMLRLKRENIESLTNTIRYYRKKTKDRAKCCEEIIVPITKNIKEALNYFVDMDSLSENETNTYLIPILNDNMNEFEKTKRTKDITDSVNKKLKVRFKNYKISTYSARHTFATNMRKLGASTDEICQCLGHSSVLVTKYYLDSIDSGIIAKYTNQL